MTIKEVADKFGLSADTLRYYEKVGLIGPIKKNQSGIRNYDENDLDRIKFVKCMRSADLPVAILVEYLRLYEQGEKTLSKRRQLLVSQRELLKQKLDEIQSAYDKLNYKIDLYDKQLLEKNCQFNS